MVPNTDAICSVLKGFYKKLLALYELYEEPVVELFQMLSVFENFEPVNIQRQSSVLFLHGSNLRAIFLGSLHPFGYTIILCAPRASRRKFTDTGQDVVAQRFSSRRGHRQWKDAHARATIALTLGSYQMSLQGLYVGI